MPPMRAQRKRAGEHGYVRRLRPQVQMNSPTVVPRLGPTEGLKSRDGPLQGDDYPSELFLLTGIEAYEGQGKGISQRWGSNAGEDAVRAVPVTLSSLGP